MSIVKQVAWVVGFQLALLGIAYFFVDGPSSKLVESLQEQGLDAKMSGDTLVVRKHYAANDYEGYAMLRGTADERRRITEVSVLKLPQKDIVRVIKSCRGKHGMCLRCDYFFSDGQWCRVELPYYELHDLVVTRPESARLEDMRGALRNYTEACEQLYPQDDQGALLRGSALAAARSTTDGLVLVPYRLVGDTLYEVVSRPRITPNDVQANRLEGDALDASLEELMDNEPGRAHLAAAYLARVAYVRRYEAPDGGCYERRYSAEMVRRVYERYLLDAEYGAKQKHHRIKSFG